MSLLSVPDKLENLPKLREWLAAFRIALLTEGLGGGGADIYASTRVVDPDGSGTHTTLDAALISLPAEGGTIFIKGGTYDFSSGLTVPANTRIVGAGRNSTILNMVGAFTLFTTTGGYFCLAEVTVQGDDTTAQTVFNTDHNIEVACSDFKNINGVIQAVSSDVDVEMNECYIELATSAGTGIFLWKGATGGDLEWAYVNMVVPVTDTTIIEGPTPMSAGCNWKVVQSYTGAPPPPPPPEPDPDPEPTSGPPIITHYYYVQSINWLNFELDDTQITVNGNDNKVVGCNLADSFLRITGSQNQVGDCSFYQGGNDPVFDAQLIIAATSGVAETTVSGCSFKGNSIAFRGIAVENCNLVAITGCIFSSHTFHAILLGNGGTTEDSVATITGCSFLSEEIPVFEAGPSSLVDGSNYRNIITWGADPSGITDSSAAIQSAVDSLPITGGTIYFPPGTYAIFIQIVLPDKLVIIKGCDDATIITTGTGGMDIFVIPDGLTAVRNYVFEGFSVTGSSVVAIGGALAGGPFSDTFATAGIITGANGTILGSNVGFTKEAGEPATIAGNAGGHSGWLEWTAPIGGTCVIDLFGSSFDTLLAVYTGATVSTLTVVVANDDSVAPSSLQSKVTFAAIMGTVYHIVVDGFGASSGSIVLNMSVVGGAQANSIVSVRDTGSVGNVKMVHVNTEFVQNIIDITTGDSFEANQIQVVLQDCRFKPSEDNIGAILRLPSAFFPVSVHMDRVRYLNNFEAYDLAPPDTHGGSIVLHGTTGVYTNVDLHATNCIFHITDDSTFGAVHMENCYIKNILTPTVMLFMFVLGATTPAETSLINVGCDNNIYWSLSDASTVIGGTYRDTILALFPTDEFGGSITGAQFFSGPNNGTVIATSGAAINIDGCFFAEDTAVVSAHYIDLFQSSGGASNISNCSFATLSAGSDCAIRVIQSGTTNRAVSISNCWFDQPNVPPIIEQLTTSVVHYNDNMFEADCLAPTIIGTGSVFNGARNLRTIGGALTSSFVDKLTHLNQKGIVGIGTLLNAGANSLEVRETVIDILAGTTSTRTTTVTTGNSVLLSPQTNIGTAVPPYKSYVVAVRFPGASTTFSLCFTTMGAQ